MEGKLLFTNPQFKTISEERKEFKMAQRKVLDEKMKQKEKKIEKRQRIFEKDEEVEDDEKIYD